MCPDLRDVRICENGKQPCNTGSPKSHIFAYIPPLQPLFQNLYVPIDSNLAPLKGTVMGTPNKEPHGYSSKIKGIYLPGSLQSFDGIHL